MSDRPVVGRVVQLSWPEAVRVVPDVAAAEAEKMAAALDWDKKRLEKLEQDALFATNRTSAALTDLGEAIEWMNSEDYEQARFYVRAAMNVLQGKPRREGL